MLIWIFGDVKKNVVHWLDREKASGYLELERARIRWFLSLDYLDIPENIRAEGKRTYRSIKVDKDEFEFSEGFTDLHTVSYEDILKGGGFGLEDARKSIETVFTIRNAVPIGFKGEYHELAKKAVYI